MTDGKRLLQVAVAILFSQLLSCGTEEDTSDKCTDVRCYGVCLSNAWDDMTESFWVFEAFCSDEKTCNCLNFCDDARCDDYCVAEGLGTGGSCDSLSCRCTGAPSDAGDDGGDDADPDASNKCTDVGCYEVCLGNAWDDTTESFWVFEAFCSDEKTCNCLNYCDDVRCEDYCVAEGLGSGGSCDFLSCGCTGAPSDAGDDGGDDAGPDAYYPASPVSTAPVTSPAA